MATRKQKKAVKLLVENGSLSTAEIMRQAGYSPNTIVDPSKLTSSKGFQELLDEYLPDETLAKVHIEGLTAVRTTRDKFGEKYEDPDYYVRHSYLETAYKIKGKLNPQRSEDTAPITINLAIYGKQDDRHSISVPAKAIPTSILGSDGRGLQPSSDSLAPKERQG